MPRLRIPGLATALALLCATAAAQKATLATPKTTPSATPGARLTSEEKSRGNEKGLEMVHYVLRVEGAPARQRYALQGRRMDGSSAAIASELRIADSGLLVGRDGEAVDLALGQLFRGEYVTMTVVSEDGSAKASVDITPFPIKAAGKGGCRLSVKPLDAKGQAFAITGSGFRPNEKLRVVSKSVDETMNTSVNGRADGSVKQVIFPAVVGRTGGDASFEAADSVCSVAVRFRWGDEMRNDPPAPSPKP